MPRSPKQSASLLTVLAIIGAIAVGSVVASNLLGSHEDVMANKSRNSTLSGKPTDVPEPSTTPGPDSSIGGTSIARPSPSTSAPGSGGTLPNDPGGSVKIGENDAEKIERRKIYQNSRDFRFLEYGGTIEPGAMYIVKHRDGSAGKCSFGWMVGQKGRVFDLTAGHCGQVGDKVYVQKDGADPVNVGEIVWQEFNGSGQGNGRGSRSDIGVGPDYALIEFYSNYVKYVQATPSVALAGMPLKLGGWKDADWLKQNRPYMCLFGWRTGLACSEFVQLTSQYTIRFEGQLDSGDSGGAVWAFDPSDPTASTIYAVAITSFEQDNDATLVGGKVIGPVMTGKGLSMRN